MAHRHIRECSERISTHRPRYDPVLSREKRVHSHSPLTPFVRHSTRSIYFVQGARISLTSSNNRFCPTATGSFGIERKIWHHRGTETFIIEQLTDLSASYVKTYVFIYWAFSALSHWSPDGDSRNGEVV